jgi:hypothetical protein
MTSTAAGRVASSAICPSAFRLFFPWRQLGAGRLRSFVRDEYAPSRERPEDKEICETAKGQEEIE